MEDSVWSLGPNFEPETLVEQISIFAILLVEAYMAVKYDTTLSSPNRNSE